MTRHPSGPGAVDLRLESDVHGRCSEAMHRCTRGVAKTIARVLNLSVRLVQAWGEPGDEKRSPAETLYMVIAEARQHRPDAEAMAPLAEVADLLGHALVRKPERPTDLLDSARALSTLLGDTGAYGAAVARAVRDGRITEAERAEASRLLAALLGSLGHVRAAVDYPEQVG